MTPLLTAASSAIGPNNVHNAEPTLAIIFMASSFFRITFSPNRRFWEDFPFFVKANRP